MIRNRLATLVVVVALATFTAIPEAHAGDPTTGDCLSASDAAFKSGNDHRLRAARSQLLICAADNCPVDVRKECLRRVDEVNPQIPTIIFAARDAAGADLSAVKVTMDGEVLAERLAGTSLSINPGERTFIFETEGQAPVTKRLVILQAQKDRREVILFGAPAAQTVGTQSTAETAAARGIGATKIFALVAGGIGLAGIGVGTIFGLTAMSKKRDAKSACPSQCSTQDGVSKWSDAGSAGNLSTLGFIIGGVGLAGASVLWFTAPSSVASAQVGVGPGALQVKGSF